MPPEVTSYLYLFLRFWLELTVWKYVGGKSINRLENPVFMEAEAYKKFVAGKPPIGKGTNPRIYRAQRWSCAWGNYIQVASVYYLPDKVAIKQSRLGGLID